MPWPVQGAWLRLLFPGCVPGGGEAAERLSQRALGLARLLLSWEAEAARLRGPLLRRGA